MNNEERLNKQKELIETLGRFYDKKGLQPVAGRILGLLSIMDKEQFTFDEIVSELQISKSAVSIALTLLENRGMIEYSTRTGDRKRYFQIRKLDKFRLLDEHRDGIKRMTDFFSAIIELKKDKNSETYLYFKEMIGMQNYFLEKFDEAKNEYEKMLCMQ